VSFHPPALQGWPLFFTHVAGASSQVDIRSLTPPPAFRSICCSINPWIPGGSHQLNTTLHFAINTFLDTRGQTASRDGASARCGTTRSKGQVDGRTCGHSPRSICHPARHELPCSSIFVAGRWSSSRHDLPKGTLEVPNGPDRGEGQEITWTGCVCNSMHVADLLDSRSCDGLLDNRLIDHPCCSSGREGRQLDPRRRVETFGAVNTPT